MASHATNDPSAVLDLLRDGNARFAANELTFEFGDVHRRSLAAGQQPCAIVLGCSDSRVPVELIFDQGIGDLFVIRVAGNIVQPSQIGSVEFAAQKFGVRLVVVLGHTNCGAVQETIAELRQPAEQQSANMAAIVSRIRPAVEGLLDQIDDESELLRHAVRENVRLSADALRHGSTVIEYLVDRGDLVIIGAEYCLDSGIVDFFDGTL